MTLLTASAIAIAAIALGLYLFDFPLVDEVFRRAQALQLNDATPTHLERDLAQAFIPARMLLLDSAFALVAIVASEAGSLATTVFGLAGMLVVASPVPHLVLGFVAPASDRYSVAEDKGLFAILGRIPRDGTLLIASDLADPAQDFRRPLRGILLTAYYGHAFYAANIRYGHYARPDAPARMLALRRFFGSPWSPWHDAWLAATGVTHVLTDDRCMPVWQAEGASALHEVARAGRWRAYEVSGRTSPAGPEAALPPAFRDLAPTYGRSECLLGRHRAGM